MSSWCLCERGVTIPWQQQSGAPGFLYAAFEHPGGSPWSVSSSFSETEGQVQVSSAQVGLTQSTGAGADAQETHTRALFPGGGGRALCPAEASILGKGSLGILTDHSSDQVLSGRVTAWVGLHSFCD